MYIRISNIKNTLVWIHIDVEHPPFEDIFLGKACGFRLFVFCLLEGVQYTSTSLDYKYPHPTIIR